MTYTARLQVDDWFLEQQISGDYFCEIQMNAVIWAFDFLRVEKSIKSEMTAHLAPDNVIILRSSETENYLKLLAN